MSLDRVSFSVWRMGTLRVFSYIEVDESYNTLYSMSYPLTHAEAADMARWATNRVECFDGSVSLDADGWYVYLDPTKVVNDESYFCPAYPTDRKDTTREVQYARLVSAAHTVNYPSV